jgi:hypothetical protein
MLYLFDDTGGAVTDAASPTFLGTESGTEDLFKLNRWSGSRSEWVGGNTAHAHTIIVNPDGVGELLMMIMTTMMMFMMMEMVTMIISNKYISSGEAVYVVFTCRRHDGSVAAAHLVMPPRRHASCASMAACRSCRATRCDRVAE